MIDSEFEYQSSDIPLLFTSDVIFSEMQTSFEESLISNLCPDYQAFCCDRLTNDIGLNSFCEALKVDVANSQESENTNDCISRTVSLIKVLFVDMGVAMKIHESALKKNNHENSHTLNFIQRWL